MRCVITADIWGASRAARNHNNIKVMRKIIAIGECVLDILFDGDAPRLLSPGGLILNVASNLGRIGREVSFVGETARDRVGDIIVDSLKANNVSVDHIDRYTEGVTPASLIFRDNDGVPQIVRYGRNNDDSFDVVWPRIEKDDILIFGGYYAIDPRVRPHLFEIVKHASERKAVILYVPGFAPEKEPRITRVMPAILENFEIADMVITRNRDLDTIFRTVDDWVAYKNNISFYVHDFINIDRDNARLRYYHDKEMVEMSVATGGNRFAWSVGAITGVIEAMIKKDITRFTLSGEGEAVMHTLTQLARETGQPVARLMSQLEGNRDLLNERISEATMSEVLAEAAEMAGIAANSADGLLPVKK